MGGCVFFTIFSLLHIYGYRVFLFTYRSHESTSSDKEPVFTSVVSIFLWYIWKARYIHVLDEPSDTLTMIWTELIHTSTVSGTLQQASLGHIEDKFGRFPQWGDCCNYFVVLATSLHFAR